MGKAENLLMTVFDFTEEECALNKTGGFSERQAQVIWTVWRGKYWLLLPLVLVFLIFGVYLSRFASPSASEDTQLIFVGIAVALSVLVGAIPLFEAARLGLDIDEAQAQQICGMVIQGKQRGQWGRYVIRLVSSTYDNTDNQETFIVSSEQFFAFDNGKPYCVYFLPHSKYILSVYPLVNPNENHDEQS